MPLKGLTMERKRVEEFKETLMYRLWVNQSCFTLGFLSQNSLWKLSYICGYKGYIYTRMREECETSGFSKQGWLVAWPRDLTKSRDNRMASCPVLSYSAPASMTLQLLACLARVQLLAACSREIQSQVPVFLAHS